MAKGQDVSLGPWPQGINLLDKPEQLADEQLLDCINFDIDNTGVLTPRRALRYKSLGGAHNKYLMGSVILDGESQPRAMISEDNAGASTFYWVGDPTAAPLTGTATRMGIFKSVVQYSGKFWYIPGNNTSVGASSPSSSTNTFTALSDMPWGDYGFVLKDRLFIVRKSTSELYFSTPTAFASGGSFTATWSSVAPNSGGVIQVNPGDNQPITKVVVVNNQIIIFKRDSTYVLSFTASPTGDGVLRQVSADQGALDAITYNNEVYCYNSRSVFKFVNGYFQDIGMMLNLINTDNIDTLYVDGTFPKVNIVGKTLILSKASGTSYAMNLDTGAWSKYTFPSASAFMNTGTVFSRSATIGTTIFFGDASPYLFYMYVSKDGSYPRSDLDTDGVTYRDPSYTFRTKDYSFDDSESWKRLYAWWADADFDASASPNGTGTVYVNGGLVQSPSDVVDLIGGSVSVRFRTISLGYTTPTVVGTATTKRGPTINGLKAVIGAKAPVSV